MKTSLKKLFLVPALFAGLSMMPSRAVAQSVVPIPTLFNTGVSANNPDGTPAALTPQGANDEHYSIVGGVDGAISPFVTESSSVQYGVDWVDDMATSQWISPEADYYYGLSEDPVGTYTYETTFDLAGVDLTTVAISGSIAADNYIAAVRINGFDIGFSGGGYGGFSGFALPSGHYTSGVNVIDFDVVNSVGASLNPSGLQVELTGTSSPAITVVVGGHIYCTCDESPIAGASVQVGTYSATSASDGSYSISGIPPGTYTATVTENPYATLTSTVTIPFTGQVVTQDFTLYPPPSLVPLRVTFPLAHVSASDSIDASIVPVTDPIALLGAPPLGMGVVADDVTPVLFEFTGAATNYTAEITQNVGSYNGNLATNIFVLQGSQWSPTTNITSASFAGGCIAYMYLSGLSWSNFPGAPVDGVTLTVNLYPTNSTTIAASASFLVRPVPIVLVHGIADNATTWSPGFTNALAQNVSSNFILAFTYGQGSGTGSPANQYWPSCTSNLDYLAIEVDTDLHNVENQLSVNWDFTRYDAVGHSQGGVLLRMLCQTNASSKGQFTANFFSVVSPENCYRGRFRRIVTIGSPHNGSLICHYLNQLRASSDWALGELAVLAMPAIQKFDPTNWQIRLINSNTFPVDSRIPFHCVQATIDDGQPPSINASLNAPLFNIIALQSPLQYYDGLSRGQLLIPLGSDGVVDFVSQGGGPGTPQSYDFKNIAHAVGGPLFGVLTTETETASAAVGIDVANLLRGPGTNFGPFILPQPISQNSLDIYNSIVPNVQTTGGTIVQGFKSAIPSTNINFYLNVPTPIS